jgi:hypothetical protein
VRIREFSEIIYRSWSIRFLEYY